jgi:hypothetical protein
MWWLSFLGGLHAFALAIAAGDGFVDQQEFEALYLQLFPHSPPDRVQSAFSQLDLEGNGRVDIISWSHRIHLADMPAMVQRIRKHGASDLRARQEAYQHLSVA